MDVIEETSNNRQFAMVLVFGILFCGVLGGIMWYLQMEQKHTKQAEIYMVDAVSNGFEMYMLADGVTSGGVEMFADVEIYPHGRKNIVFEDQIKLVSNNDGLLKGDFSPLNYLEGSYDVLVKGEKHRQMKYEGVVIKSGVLDLTMRSMQAGDIALAGVQDKKVNIDDYEAVVSRMGSVDAVDVELSDLNYDGVINSYDRSLLLKTLLNNK